MTECPRCSQPVQPGFRVCPICQMRLDGDPMHLPKALPAEQQGRRDTAMIGFGIMVLGMLAAILPIFLANSGLEMALTISAGAILLLFAGSMITGVGLTRRQRTQRGAAGSFGTLILGIVVGGLLFVAALGFVFLSCTVLADHA